MEKGFSVFEALATGTQRAFDNFRLFFLAGLTFGFICIGSVLGIALLVFLASGTSFAHVQHLWAAGQLSAESQHLMANVTSHALPLIALSIVVALIFFGLGIGYTKMALEVYDRGTSTVSKLFSCFLLVPQTVIASIIYGCIVGVATIFFVIPGMYLALRFGLFFYFIIDKNAGIIECLKQSYEATAGFVWQMFAVYAILTSITLVVPFMGLFVMPISVCTWSYVYRTLTAQKMA